MKKLKKSYKKNTDSFSHVLIIPLVIAVIIIISAFILSNLDTTETRSKASYSTGIEQCLNICQTDPRVKNAGDCALDCTKVIAQTITCFEFCGNNSKSNKENFQMACARQCAGWAYTNPCGAKGICTGIPKIYAGTCQMACKQVQSDTKTCAEAYTQQRFPKATTEQIETYTQRCVNEFEQ